MSAPVPRIYFAALLAALLLPPHLGAQQATTPAVGSPAAKKTKTPAPISPQVRAAAEQGMKFLEQERYKDAANAFLAAARKYPRNGQLRHLLGYSFAKNKQLGQAWLQFRQAVRLSPDYEPAVRDFLAVWNSFDRSGVLNIGRTPAEVEKAIGKPDAKQERENRIIWEYGFMRVNFLDGILFSLVDPRGVRAEMATPDDFMQLELNANDWRLGYRSVNRLQTVSEYTPPDQTVQKWDELFTIQRLYGLVERKMTPREMMRQIQQDLTEIDTKITFAVLQDGDSDVLFRWRDPGDRQRPAQHEFVRLVAGKKDLHRLAYSRKAAKLPAGEAEKWTGLLRQAKLTPLGNSPGP